MDRYRKEVLQVSTQKHGINVQYLYDTYLPSYETFFKPALCIVKHRQNYFVELVPVSNQICVQRMHKLTHGRRKVIFDKQFRFLPVSLSSYSLRKGYVNSPLNW